MSKTMYLRFFLVVATGWLLCAAGCGPKLLTVEGTVTWDGSPVETGTINHQHRKL